MADGDNNNTQPPQQPPAEQQQPDSQWQYSQDEAAANTPVPAANESIEWTASEFIAHDKGFSWYLLLAIIGLVVAAIIYLITRDVVSVAVICLFAIILGVAGAHKPRTLTYMLDGRGLSAGKKFYSYGDFRSFALVEEGVFNSITLLPIKRFSLPVNLYITPADEQNILGVLGQHLPMQQGGMDLTDNLMRRMHF